MMMGARYAIAAVVIMLAAGAASAAAFGQDAAGDGAGMGALAPYLGFAAFMTAGLYYTSIGFVSRYARRLAGEQVPIDWRKVRNAFILGVILGIGAFITSVISDEVTIEIHTWKDFFGQTAVAVASVLTVHKLLISSRPRPELPPTMEDISRDGIPGEQPPGAGN